MKITLEIKKLDPVIKLIPGVDIKANLELDEFSIEDLTRFLFMLTENRLNNQLFMALSSSLTPIEAVSLAQQWDRLVNQKNEILEEFPCIRASQAKMVM